MSTQATVAFKPLGNCLANLPEQLIAPFVESMGLVVQNVVVKLEFGTKQLHLGWTGFYSPPRTIELDPSFAEVSQLKEHTSCIATVVFSDQLQRIQSAELVPLTAEDWELTELYAGTIEDRFLNQVRTLATQQTIGIHPTATAGAIRYKVKRIVSESDEISLGLLMNESELHIEPKLRRAARNHKMRTIPLPKLEPVLVRSVALPHSKFNYTENNYCVYMNFNPHHLHLADVKYVKVSLAPGPGSPQRAIVTGKNAEDTTVPADCVVAKLVNDSQLPPGVAGLSQLLAISLGLEGTVGEGVVLEHVDIERLDKAAVTSVVMHPINDESNPANVDALIRSLFGGGQVPITNGMKLPIEKTMFPHGSLIEFNGQKPAWFLLEDELPPFVKGSKVTTKSSFVQHTPKKYASSKIVARDQILSTLTRNIDRYVPSIVYGGRGSGKTLVLQTLADRFVDELYYIKYVDCERLINSVNQENLKKWVESTVHELTWHSPSILMLDNLENLIPQEPEQADGTFSSQVTEVLVSQLSQIKTTRKVALLCSARSRDAVNPICFLKHFVEEEVALVPPTREQRFELLDAFTQTHSIPIEDTEFLRTVASDTEGYLPFDLEILTDRAFHDVVASGASEFTATNFDTALSGFTPSSLRGINLQKDTSTSWSDIGGLTDAKQILLETLEWPTRYAPIFAKCPLRLRSGILLYGYPGCGKTMLASAVASQCGLHFISIKGPEILNKYIGASEQSVRELFERASAAKPCILFFDEFDSIAPKRGHDSTGVTDRIVNQLLTQMDGAEDLQGVYVLAATSRPDLIDSALLRPGRLDKSVICDMPDEADRLDILKAISNKFKLAEDVDLAQVAAKTRGFSGADLQAFVYNSYLKAVHESLEAADDDAQPEDDGPQYFVPKGGQIPSDISKRMKNIHLHLKEDGGKTMQAETRSKKPTIVIKKNHFELGLEETGKSISAKELAKFQQIYGEFGDNKRENSLPNGEASQEIGGRVSLM